MKNRKLWALASVVCALLGLIAIRDRRVPIPPLEVRPAHESSPRARTQNALQSRFMPRAQSSQTHPTPVEEQGRPGAAGPSRALLAKEPVGQPAGIPIPGLTPVSAHFGKIEYDGEAAASPSDDPWARRVAAQIRDKHHTAIGKLSRVAPLDPSEPEVPFENLKTDCAALGPFTPPLSLKIGESGQVLDALSLSPIDPSVPAGLGYCRFSGGPSDRSYVTVFLPGWAKPRPKGDRAITVGQGSRLEAE